MNRFLAGFLVVAVFGCGPVELEAERVAFTRQAGKTGQGKTGQGKTGQGKTGQGTQATGSGVVFAVNRGSWQVRTANKMGDYSYRAGQADLVPYAATTRKTTQLKVTSNNVVYPVSSVTHADDQTAYPLATFLMQELNDSMTAVSGSAREARIVNTWADTSTDVNLLEPAYKSLFSGSAVTPNTDIRLYKIQVRKAANNNEWEDFCQGDDTNGKAVLVPGVFNSKGAHITSSNAAQYLSVACVDGTAAKCMRWGYRPWRSLNNVQLEPVWLACTRAAMADYCSNNRGYTEDGTRIDLWDRYGFIAKSPETDGWIDANGIPEAYSDESAFDQNGAVCLVRERLFTINFETAVCPMTMEYIPGNRGCVNPTTGVSTPCGPKGVVSTPTNVFDRHPSGTSCEQVATAANRTPLIYISSFTSGCGEHTPFEWPHAALAIDCNAITNSVCTLARPQCCAEDNEGRLLAGAWDATCAQLAVQMANGTWSPDGL